MAVTNVSQRISQPHLLKKKNKRSETKPHKKLNHNKSSSLQLVYFNPEQTVQMAL